MAKGPNKSHHPFSTPQSAKQHGRKVGGANGRTHEITPVAKPRGPSAAVKYAENAKQGERPLKAQVMPKIVHKSKNVRTP